MKYCQMDDHWLTDSYSNFRQGLRDWYQQLDKC